MKSYLSLIPISARVHKRQNRMTLFCIIIAVFLVTAIFSMADMGIRTEKINLINRHGNWHVMLKNIQKDKAEAIGARADVAAASWYNVINYNIDENYLIGGKKTVLCGADEKMLTDIMDCISEGGFPSDDGEIMLSENAKSVLSIKTGDNVTVNTPSGNAVYKVSGFCSSTSFIMQSDVIGAFMNMNTFDKLEGTSRQDLVYYVQLKENINMRKAIEIIKSQYGLTDDNMSLNNPLLGTMGFSDDSYMMGLYAIAAVLFLLILTAGVLMITGSINSNVAERSQFFGMLRCIGASKKQIVRFVRLEALNWCKTAIPIGVISGVAVTWGLCALLRIMAGGDFSDIPVFGVSIIGIVCGIIVGILTVFLAARSPAKRAAKVSPMAAVSGNSGAASKVRHAANTRFFKIETALGINRAVSAKKNLILMTGSFALSIILFLGFSVFLEWTHYALNTLKPYAPDISIMSSENSEVIDEALALKINQSAGVKRAFGRMYKNIPAQYENKNGSIDLISYDVMQLNWAKKDILDGDISKIRGGENDVLTVFDKSNSLKTGDKIKLENTELTVAGTLSDSPFDTTDTPTVICSEEAFKKITGKCGYAVMDIQLKKDASEANVTALRELAGEKRMFSDRRATNKEANGTFWAFNLFVYGFLAIIAMITVFNIINSISMSVSARVKQYGAMRAVGMDGGQLAKMIAAEAVCYALLGSITGCLIGLPLNRFLFNKLITAYWGNPWSVPYLQLAIILLIVAAATAAAVYVPSKRIKNTAVTAALNEL